MAKKPKNEDEILNAGVIGEENPDIETVNEDADGQKRIPGTEIQVVKPIIEFVKRREATKKEHKMLTEKLVSENNEADVLYQKYVDYFVEIEDGKMIYEAGGAQLIVTKPGALKFTTKIIPTDVPAKAKGAPKE